MRRSRSWRVRAPPALRACARQPRRGAPHAHLEGRAPNGKLRQLGRAAPGQGGVDPLPGGVEVRIVHELIGPAQGREGHARPLQPLRQLRARVASHLLADARGQPPAGGHALGIVVEAGIGPEIVERELLAEALPVTVGGDADEDLFPVGGGEELVDPPAHARALLHLGQGHRRLARGAVLGQPLPDPEHRRLEEARGDPLPEARLRPLLKRREDGDHAVRGGAHVHDRGARAHGLAARAGHEGQPPRHLRQLVEEWLRLVRAGEEALEGEIDEARIGAGEHVVAQAQGLHRAVGEVVDHHVGDGGEAQEQRAALRRALEIDGDAALVAVEEMEEGRRPRGHGARLIALAPALHLDHVGAEIGQNEPRGGSGHDVPELQNPYSFEGQRVRGAHGRRSDSMGDGPCHLQPERGYSTRWHGER